MRKFLTLTLFAAALLAPLLAARSVAARCLDEDCRPGRPTATAPRLPLWTPTAIVPAATLAPELAAPMSTDIPPCPQTPPPKGDTPPDGLCVRDSGPVTRPASATPLPAYP